MNIIFQSSIGHFNIEEVKKIYIFDFQKMTSKNRIFELPLYWSALSSFQKNIFTEMSETYLVIHKTLLEQYLMPSGAVRKQVLKFWVDLPVFFCPTYIFLSTTHIHGYHAWVEVLYTIGIFLNYQLIIVQGCV